MIAAVTIFGDCAAAMTYSYWAPMDIRYRVDLSRDEQDVLKQLLNAGKCAARRLKRAQILLAAGAGCNDDAIETTIGASSSTIYGTKRRFVECGLEAGRIPILRPV